MTNVTILNFDASIEKVLNTPVYIFLGMHVKSLGNPFWLKMMILKR